MDARVFQNGFVKLVLFDSVVKIDPFLVWFHFQRSAEYSTTLNNKGR